jgi:site-specific recombinase XerD
MHNKKQQNKQENLSFSQRKRNAIEPSAAIYLKKKLKSDNAGWLYVRCYQAGQRVERSLGIKVKESEWNADNECIPRNAQVSKEIWDAKEKFLLDLADGLNYARQLSVSSPDLRMAADLVSGRLQIPELMLQVFELEIDRMRLNKGEGFSKANIQKHSVCKTHFSNYVFKTHRRKDVLLSEMSKKMVEGFIDYLRTEGGCQHNSAMKHLQVLKKMYRIALDNMWVQHNPFAGIKISIKTVKRDYLDQEEIDAIESHEFKTDRLNVVRDYFIFSCYTGLAYIDLMALKRSSLKEYLGRTWINMERVKTHVSATIPLLAPARFILERHQPKWKELPTDTSLFKRLSNQKMNAYLKEIAAICGIEKDVCFHMARHSFATTITLANNIPIETVSKLLAHNRIAQTQHYSKVVDQKIDRDIAALSDKLDEAHRKRHELKEEGTGIIRTLRFRNSR